MGQLQRTQRVQSTNGYNRNNNMRAGQMNTVQQSPLQSAMQSYQDQQFGNNISNIYDNAIGRQSDGMYNGISINRGDFDGWTNAKGNPLSDKEMYNAAINGEVNPQQLASGDFQQQLNMMNQGYSYAPNTNTLQGLVDAGQARVPNIHEISNLEQGMQEQAFRNGTEAAKAFDPKYIQALQNGGSNAGTLTNAVTQGTNVVNNGVQTANVANQVAQGANAANQVANGANVANQVAQGVNAANAAGEAANVAGAAGEAANAANAAQMAAAADSAAAAGTAAATEGAAAGTAAAGAGAEAGLAAAAPWALGALGVYGLGRWFDWW